MINKKLINTTRLAIYSICSVFLAGEIQAANPSEAKTIGRVIRERHNLSKFLQFIDKTEAGSNLSEKTNIRRTVFAPVDSAFDKLPNEALKTLLDPRNKDRLDEVFGFHVCERYLPAIGLEKFNTLRMASGQFLSCDCKKGTISGARFTGEIIECTNGVIYLIDSVLEPNTDDLFQTLQKDGRFKIFTKAITASRQGKRFQNMHSVYTALAPTDKAFKKLPAAFIESLFLPENDERLEDIIKHHIIEDVRPVGYNPNYYRLGISGIATTSAFGQQINFKRTENGPTIDGAKIIQADIPCANGLIHVIDTVNAPVESGLLDILRKDQRFSTLVYLLERSGLHLAAASSTPYTIFAPVNEAFKKEPYASLIADKNKDNREVIYALLARHVISGKHVSENCIEYTKLRTISDAPIILTRSGSTSKINGITISETDIEGFNGLINVIDTVIEDPMELPERDLSTVDAINFVQKTLTDAAVLYKSGKYEDCCKYYTARGYEYIAKYPYESSNKPLRDKIKDIQTLYHFSKRAWTSRNAFRDLLRLLEKRSETVQDSYLMLKLEKARFGR